MPGGSVEDQASSVNGNRQPRPAGRSASPIVLADACCSAFRVSRYFGGHQWLRQNRGKNSTKMTKISTRPSIINQVSKIFVIELKCP